MPADYWAPHVTVAAVIEQDGRYLFVEEEVDGRRVLNQPAGHLEPGESLQDAVIREVREETGYAFTPSGLLAVHQWRAPGGDSFLRFSFSGSAEAVDSEPADESIIALHWLSRAELQAPHCRLRSPMVSADIERAGTACAAPLELIQPGGMIAGSTSKLSERSRC